MAAIRVRVTRRSNVVYVYVDDPAVPRAQLGPKGNFVMAIYLPGSQRSHYEAAFRGYGDEAQGQAILRRALGIADRVAARHKVGTETGPLHETEVAKGELPAT